jgi:hypothetical protein
MEKSITTSISLYLPIDLNSEILFLDFNFIIILEVLNYKIYSMKIIFILYSFID